MPQGGKTLSQEEIERLVHDILANETLRLDKVRALAVLRERGYDDPGLELARIEAEFNTPGNLLISEKSIGKALDQQIAAAEITVHDELLATRSRRELASRR
jgi:hypothetical protein